MAKTNLQIKAKNAATEASITTTLPYVNPEANSATLKSFAQKLNGLTTNIYDEANRVQSINVDTEDVPKITSTIALSKDSYNNGGDAIWIPYEDIQTNSDATTNNYWGVLQYRNTESGQIRYIEHRVSSGKNFLVTEGNLNITNYPTNATLRLAINETTTHSAAVLVKSITLTNN